MITITSIVVEPNPAPIAAELSLLLEFVSERVVICGTWNFSFIVDCAARKLVIPLGDIRNQVYAAGMTNSVKLSVACIDLTDVPRHVLLNMGLVQATLTDGDEHIVDVKLVTQVTGDKGSALLRVIYNPLE